MKNNIVDAVIAIALIGVCVGTWLNPDLISIDRSKFSGGGGWKFRILLNIIWSRPTGSIAGLFGLILGWEVLTKKDGQLPRGDNPEE